MHCCLVEYAEPYKPFPGFNSDDMSVEKMVEELNNVVEKLKDRYPRLFSPPGEYDREGDSSSFHAWLISEKYPYNEGEYSEPRSRYTFGPILDDDDDD